MKNENAVDNHSYKNKLGSRKIRVQTFSPLERLLLLDSDWGGE